MTTQGGGGKKPKKPRKARKTPVAGSPEAASSVDSAPVRDSDAEVPDLRPSDAAGSEPVQDEAAPVRDSDAELGPSQKLDRRDGIEESGPLRDSDAEVPRSGFEPARRSAPESDRSEYEAGAFSSSDPAPQLPDPVVERPRRAETVRVAEDHAGVAADIPQSVPSPDWALDSSEAEARAVPPPPTPEAVAASLPDPKAAAIEAARIVGEIVGDIESAGGAAIVAAAAAGAAIEAARARSRAVADPEAAAAAAAADVIQHAADSQNADPVVTVRMQRDRILRALAEDIAAQTEAQAAGQAPAADPIPTTSDRRPGSIPDHAPSAPARVSTSPGTYASAQTSSAEATNEEGGDEAFDPVQIAAAAIGRLRKRAKTDLAELRTHYHRHDILVLLVAFMIIVVAGRVHRRIVTPPTVKFPPPGTDGHGLVFEHSQAWLAPEPLPSPTPRIIHELSGQPSKSNTRYHVEFTSSIDPGARIEVWIDKKPAWSNIVTGLELDRRTRWGELYTLDDSSVRSIAGHDWLRTVYRYAHAADKGDVPRVDRAIEYATIDREQIYVITLFGSPAELDRIEEVVAPTLRVPTQTGLPLVPQTRTLAQRTYPNAVARAFDSTVMIVAADLIDGRLKPRGGGSGVIVGGDGSILTNYHVIHDKDGRLHDVFVIGRFSAPDQAPQLWCAGRPNRSKLQRELDLALIKCDLDLDGRSWVPGSNGVWATLPEAHTADIRMGQRLWVLGYPDVGGGGLTLSEGEVEGWTGEDGTAGKDFIKTDASITHGNSGGPVIDDHGRLVGIASAFRTKVSASGGVIETSQVGLVRPLATATDLLAIAAAGWIPREGHTDVELQPSAVEAPAEGVRISTKVMDASNESPVRDALVMVLRPGVAASDVDVNRLDDQVLSWGRSNTLGEVQLKQPVPIPGAYTVMIVARGFEPLIGENELHLDANTPPAFDPWGKIWLRSR